MDYLFEEGEMPYEILNRYGLSQEMIDDLPVDVLNDLLNGMRSPVLPVKMALPNGEVIKDRVRFSLKRMESGSVDVVFYPILEKTKFNYMESQMEKLATNRAFRGYRNAEEEHQGKEYYIQLDAETRHVLSVPVLVLERNLQLLRDKYHLIQSEINTLKNGEVLTIFPEDTPITIGVDLNSRTGIRLSEGNVENWYLNSKREWEKYTFGAFGCWVMSDDGSLDYISEDDYTEEIWNEQKAKGLRHSTQKL